MRKLNNKVCMHVRSLHVIPGWGCCRCRVYNGYHRETCRSCGHPPCYSTDGELGEEARKFKAAGIDRDKIITLLSKEVAQ